MVPLGLGTSPVPQSVTLLVSSARLLTESADGVVTGIGSVDGRPVAIAAYDFTVLAGTMGDVGEDKVARMRALALGRRIPFVWLLDSAGARVRSTSEFEGAVVSVMAVVAAAYDVDVLRPIAPGSDVRQLTYATLPAKAEYKHKKQTGGSGQYARVKLRVEPAPGKEFEFANEIKGGSIPTKFIPPIEKGIVETMTSDPKPIAVALHEQINRILQEHR